MKTLINGEWNSQNGFKFFQGNFYLWQTANKFTVAYLKHGVYQNHKFSE